MKCNHCNWIFMVLHRPFIENELFVPTPHSIFNRFQCLINIQRVHFLIIKKTQQRRFIFIFIFPHLQHQKINNEIMLVKYKIEAKSQRGRKEKTFMYYYWKHDADCLTCIFFMLYKIIFFPNHAIVQNE